MHIRRRGAVVAAALALTLLPGASSTAVPAAPAAVLAPAPAAPQPVGDLARWDVVDLGDGRYRVSWTSPRDLPVGSDRPTVSGADLTFGAPVVGADRRTVEAVVTSGTAPDPADLDVVLSGDRLDEPGSDLAGPVAPAVEGPAPRDTLLDAPDPAQPGPFTTVTSDYELPAVALPGMRRPIEMVGHVVEPAADQVTGPRPLVLFLHGRHGYCYDPDDDSPGDAWPCAPGFEDIRSELGYDYLQRLLASQGHTTVSVRVNGINAQDFVLADGGAGARAAIVERHLDHWTTMAAVRQVDLGQVVLVGHSRGGEGVDLASTQVPLTAPYRIVGQVLLAPTDFASRSAPYVPTVTLLPYCDGDVSDIQGQRFTDAGRDLVAGDTALKSSVLVMGANHNFFNTEWTPGATTAPAADDWVGELDEPCGRRHPDRLRAPAQRAVAQAWVGGAVRLFTGDDRYLPLVDGSHVTVASVGDADVRSHALGGGRDVRRPGLEATPTASSGGGQARLCAGVLAYDLGPADICGGGLRTQVAPHFTDRSDGRPAHRFLELAWTQRGAVGGLRFDQPLDLTSDRLELRTIVDPRRGPVDLRVRLTDGSGALADLVPRGGSRLAPLLVSSFLTKLWAQSLLVDASAVPGIDLADVVSVELLADSRRGRVWVADLAAAPPVLAPVPEARLPVVRLGELEIVEGDPVGTGPRAQAVRTARVPFTVTGTLTRPAQLTVLTVGQELGAPDRLRVDVAPGQTSGSIPVRWTADRLDDFESATTVAAWAVRGVAVAAQNGELAVEDDDRAPRVRISVPATVGEGQPVVAIVRNVGGLADYDLGVVLEVRRAKGSPLRGTDVPASVLQFLGPDVDPSLPLWRLAPAVFGTVRPGAPQARLLLPTRRDGVREGTETVRVRVSSGEVVVLRTVRVLDGP
ncbi:MAG: secreted protein [Nocardioides sp.]|nr:secreted protein [Nocardioides sp.]